MTIEHPGVLLEVVVVDKGRAPGARIAVRRAAGFELDHGAQYFTVQNDRLAARVAAWLRKGIVAEWQGRFGTLRGGAFEAVRSQKARYVGRPTMSAVARHLAADLQIQSGVRVLKIEARSLRWRLAVEGGAEFGDFDTVLVTVPAPRDGARTGEGCVSSPAATVLGRHGRLRAPTRRAVGRRLRSGLSALVGGPQLEQAGSAYR